MSLAQGNNTPTRPRIEPGSPDPGSDGLTTRPVLGCEHAVLITCVSRHLTHISLASFLWDIGNKKSPRCDAAQRGVPSGVILFAVFGISSKNEIKNEK